MNAAPSSRYLRGRLARSLGPGLVTVWSNCLAGGWLGGYLPGGERPVHLALLLLGASALYAAGIFLGIASDRPSDASAGPVLRGWLRERTVAGLVLTGGSRLLLYPLASAASLAPALSVAAGEGLLLASYVVGLGLLGYEEGSPDRLLRRWPWLLIVLPIAINAVLAWRLQAWRVVVVALPAFWLLRIALGRTVPLKIGRGAALLAGVVLFDLRAVAACAPFLPWLGWFAILFALVLACQRFVPAE